MVEIIQAQNINLPYLKQKFALQKSKDNFFFRECLQDSLTVSEL
jgi:hypothetical protein